MNFRRGFLRLWAVGSVLFVVAVGLFSYGRVAYEFERSGPDWAKFPTLIPVDCQDARGKSGTDYEGIATSALIPVSAPRPRVRRPSTGRPITSHVLLKIWYRPHATWETFG